MLRYNEETWGGEFLSPREIGGAAIQNGGSRRKVGRGACADGIEVIGLELYLNSGAFFGSKSRTLYYEEQEVTTIPLETKYVLITTMT